MRKIEVVIHGDMPSQNDLAKVIREQLVRVGTRECKPWRWQIRLGRFTMTLERKRKPSPSS
jgi:hypothetical protein